MEAYAEFQKRHIEFLREDVVAASCCLEHISLLEPDDPNVETLLNNSLKFAGENYDVLQQSVLVNIRLGKTDEVVKALREMVANNYNMGLNAKILGRIYINAGNREGYDALQLATCANDDGLKYIGEWNDDADKADKKLLENNRGLFIGVVKTTINKVTSLAELKKLDGNLYKNLAAVFEDFAIHCKKNSELVRLLKYLLVNIKSSIGGASKDKIAAIQSTSKKIIDELERTEFTLEFSDRIADLSDKFHKSIKEERVEETNILEGEA